jgi:ATP-dependent Clp protease ATP-binding subunit ClpC
MLLANEEARHLHHEYIGTEHILLGLVKEGAGVAANVLKNLGVDAQRVRQEVEKRIADGRGEVTKGILPQTPRAKKAIEYAMEESRNLNHNYLGTEHLLLGLLRAREGVAAQVLMNCGLKLDQVRDEVLNIVGHTSLPRQDFAGRWADDDVPGLAPQADRKLTALVVLATIAAVLSLVAAVLAMVAVAGAWMR